MAPGGLPLYVPTEQWHAVVRDLALILVSVVVVQGVGRGGDEAEYRALVVGDDCHPAVRAVVRGADDLAAVAGDQVDGLVGVGGAEVDPPERLVRVPAAARAAADAADDLLAVDE